MGGQYRITGDKYPRLRRPRRRRRLVLAVVASATALGLIGWGTLQLIDVFTGDNDQAAAAGPKADCASRVSPSPTAGGPAEKSGASGKSGASKASGSSGTSGKDFPAPGKITVNVLNATPRAGLAKETADELKKRGFRIGNVGNATEEYDKKVKGTALLLGAKAAEDAALPVLNTQLTGARMKTDGRAKATEVDLIIGTGFKSLSKQKDADRALATLARPVPTPTATKTC
ncbi:LytR C-terminal domain-containing protein [Streptomyces sp. DSM 40750]|uniref:LytR C-terminal domain-containing protein n=1 Tax=Streptomyces sp. DSM 40750 TaxID=2801030 RepID=UPI00214B033B|nr:LytR C-terminal domain-containing protein [Streptomyces sp. DSM 40750]UUU28109.1 LytR C-terminal domain-containing protein [Streptomyces sp. DSM 40750]